MSVKVVRLPFRSNGKVYRSGDLIESPDGIQLYATKVKHRTIVEVDEHNLDEVALYLERRRGIKDAKNVLLGYLGKPVGLPANPVDPPSKYDDPAYIDKVLKLAEKHELNVEGKSIQQVVEELKSLKK